MEGILLEAGFLNSTMATAGLLVLLAGGLGGILFGYIADEEAKGRRIDWLEEPLTMGGGPEQVVKGGLRKAA